MCVCVCVWEYVCVLGLGTDLSANRDRLSPVCPPLLSLIGNEPHWQIKNKHTLHVTHRDSGWRSVVSREEEEDSAISCPDSRHFGSFILKASTCQPPTHYTAYIRMASHIGAPTARCHL